MSVRLYVKLNNLHSLSITVYYTQHTDLEVEFDPTSELFRQIQFVGRHDTEESMIRPEKVRGEPTYSGKGELERAMRSPADKFACEAAIILAIACF